MKLLMGTKRQFKMYLDEDLIERMRIVAGRAGKSSGQEVAEEVLSIYLPVWSSVSDSTRRAIEYQTNKIVGRGTIDKAVDQHLAPVVARISPAIDPKEEVRRMVNADGDRIAQVQNIGRLTDERAAKKKRSA